MRRIWVIGGIEMNPGTALILAGQYFLFLIDINFNSIFIVNISTRSIKIKITR